MPTGLTHGKAGKAESNANIWVSEPWKSGAIYKNGKLEKESCFESRYTYSKISQSVELLFGYANEKGCISNVGPQGARDNTNLYLLLNADRVPGTVQSHLHTLSFNTCNSSLGPLWPGFQLRDMRLEEMLGHRLRSCNQWESDGLGLEHKSVQFQISVARWHCAVSFRRM